MAALIRRYDRETEEFHQKFTRPHEEWLKGVRKWPGGYRWFRSPNITPIEYYRRVRIQAPAPTKRAG